MDEPSAKKALKALESCIEALASEISTIEGASTASAGEAAAQLLLKTGMYPVPNMSAEAEQVLRELAVKLPAPPVTEEVMQNALRVFVADRKEKEKAVSNTLPGLTVDAELAVADAPPPPASKDTPRAGSKRKAAAMEAGKAGPSPAPAKASTPSGGKARVGRDASLTESPSSSSSLAKECPAEPPVRSSQRPRTSTDLDKDYVMDMGGRARTARKEEREKKASPKQSKEEAPETMRSTRGAVAKEEAKASRSTRNK